MATRKFANNAWGNLAVGISNVATSLSYTLGSGASAFPTLSAGDFFDVTLLDAALNREVIRVTAGSAGTFSTITRGVDGTTARAWLAGDRIGLRMNAAALAELQRAGDPVSGIINELHGADIASGSTINLDTATGNLVDVTGTTNITAITLSDGHERTVRFTGALTLTNGASLVLPGAANIVTAAGDVAVFRGYASGIVRLTSYLPNRREVKWELYWEAPNPAAPPTSINGMAFAEGSYLIEFAGDGTGGSLEASFGIRHDSATAPDGTASQHVISSSVVTYLGAACMNIVELNGTFTPTGVGAVLQVRQYYVRLSDGAFLFNRQIELNKIWILSR